MPTGRRESITFSLLSFFSMSRNCLTDSLPRPLSSTAQGVRRSNLAHKLGGPSKTSARRTELDKGGTLVLLLPGLFTGEAFMRPLQNHLLAAGVDSQTWGLGINSGPQEDVATWLKKIVQHLRARSKGYQNVVLVGWSLGGMIAREVAKEIRNVAHVITIGSPVAPSYDGTRLGWMAKLGLVNASIDEKTQKKFSTPPIAPVTAILGKQDWIVSEESCRYRERYPNVAYRSIDAGHFSLVVSESTFQVVEQTVIRRG